MVHARPARANFRPQGAPFGLKRTLPRIERGRSKVKWVKNHQFSFLGGGALDQGALPWLISHQSPELWPRR